MFDCNVFYYYDNLNWISFVELIELGKYPEVLILWLGSYRRITRIKLICYFLAWNFLMINWHVYFEFKKKWRSVFKNRFVCGLRFLQGDKERNKKGTLCIFAKIAEVKRWLTNVVISTHMIVKMWISRSYFKSNSYVFTFLKGLYIHFWDEVSQQGNIDY